MADVRRTFTGLEPDAVRANLDRVRERAGAEVAVLAAVKYVPSEELPALAEAGIELVGENRAQELVDKRAAHADLFTWDFIGQLQSRKVKEVAPEVRLIHSVASDSVLRKLEANPAPEVLIQVNVAGEEGKEGILPADLGDFIARCPVRVTGLSTMPPFAEDAEDNRRHFARLAELAGEHGLERLSMGTTQDYWVAAQEGATIIRVGTALYA
ncbi:MAG TPA: YggS family pyridoxal phosphate enzyme [Thermoleophilaceae bacterium]|nr:YggS family pyridoxal phosphate enzyme [Thermoleophilaceae bacterium]